LKYKIISYFFLALRKIQIIPNNEHIAHIIIATFIDILSVPEKG